MKYLFRIRLLFVLFVFVLALSACANAAVPAPTPAPTVVAVAPTATNVPPTDTPLPPTATNVPPTDTPVPPTATATLVPPTATATAIPPTPTATATSTRKPPPPPTAIPRAFTVAWKTGVQYDLRNDNSFWCKFHNEYQNLTSAEMPFQNKDTFTKVPIGPFSTGVIDGYQPVVGVANSDGTINRWAIAGWYSSYFGWPNGISDWPPKPIPASANSGDWTWYSRSSSGEYCRYAYVRWKGQTSAAEFAPKGDLINANATLPAGAP